MTDNVQPVGVFHQTLLNIAQLALGCVLGYLDFRFADRDWRARYPKLDAWYAELAQRPSFTETRPDA